MEMWSADVLLTWHEVKMGADRGVQRRLEGLAKKRKEYYGTPPGRDGWGIDIDAACGEMAAAKHTDRFWSGSHGDLGAHDAGPYQARHTDREDGSLILHKRDKDLAVFILVIGTAPRFKLVGWIKAKDGKQERFWRKMVQNGKDRSAYFVPRPELHPMSTLPLFPRA